MPEEKQSKSERKQLIDKKPALIVIVLIVAILLTVFYTIQPKRSVAAYCKVYTQEKARLAKLPGDTYPSELFDDYVSNAGEIATSVGRLEKVAPDEIRPDVATLKSFYEKLNKDPSQLLSVSMAAQPVDHSVANWTKLQCHLTK